MSDLGVIIPIAVVLVVALALGGSSGVSEPDEEEFFDDYYAGRFSEPFETRVETQTARSDMTSATEQRFDRDRAAWQENPREGVTLIRAAKDIYAEVSQGAERIQELAKSLDQVQEQDEDTRALVEELHRAIVEHQDKFVDFRERDILKYYTKELQDTELYITNSIRKGDVNFMFGAETPMTLEERHFVVQKITEILHEIKSFSDNQANIIYRAKESLKIHEQVKELQDNEFLNGGAPASELGGYAVSDTNSIFRKSVPASYERSAFTQVSQGGFGRLPSSAPTDDVPDVPEPVGGAVRGSFFANPKSLATQLEQSQLRTIREDASNAARPLTPVKPIETVNRGSPSFQKSQSEVRRIINRESGFSQSARADDFSDQASYAESDEFPKNVQTYITSESGPSGKEADKLETFMAELAQRGIANQDLRNIMDQSKGARGAVREQLIKQAFDLTPKIRSRVRSFIAPELTNPPRGGQLFKLDGRGMALFKEELKKIEGELNVARRNSDQRLLQNVKRKINNSAPPGTPKGTFYGAKLNRTSDPRQLSFTNEDVKATPAYKLWLKVANKIEMAHL